MQRILFAAMAACLLTGCDAKPAGPAMPDPKAITGEVGIPGQKEADNPALQPQLPPVAEKVRQACISRSITPVDECYCFAATADEMLDDDGMSVLGAKDDAEELQAMVRLKAEEMKVVWAVREEAKDDCKKTP